MYFDLIIECILHGNDKQKDLALKIIEQMIITQGQDNGKDN